MKALVTGACGFIGSHMVEVLAEHGHDVVAGDLPSALDAGLESRDRWPEVCVVGGARLVPMDVRDIDTLQHAVRDVEVVFHVAAAFDYLAPRHVLRAVNVEGTRNLFEAVVAEGRCRRVVNWGAGGIYGAPRADVLPFTEDGPKRPGNPYVASKWDQERVAHSFRSRGIEVTSVRPTSPYGPRGLYGSGQLLLGLARRRRIVTMRNLTANIPFVHVRDVCRAALHLADHPGADGEAYNVTDAGRVDAIALSHLVAEEMGSTVSVLPPLPLGVVRGLLSGAARLSAPVARRRGRRPLLEYDQVQYFGRDFLYSIDKLLSTGFELAMPDPEDGLRATLRWYVERGWLPSPGGTRG